MNQSLDPRLSQYSFLLFRTRQFCFILFRNKSSTVCIVFNLPSLSSLPLELRIDTIDKVIKSTTNTPPKDENDASPRATSEYKAMMLGMRKDLFDLTKYLIDPERTRCNVSGLLSTNRQFRAETLSRLPPSDGPNTKVDHALDVMVVSTQELWPTWTYLPMPTRYVNTLSVTFRIFGQSKGTPAQFKNDDPPRPQLYWAFYGVLERFLKVGPAIKALEGDLISTDRRITVRSLNLEIPGGQGDGLRVKRAFYESYSDESGDSDSGEPPTWVVRSEELIRELDRMWFWVFEDDLPYGTAFWDRLGNITLTMDKVVVKEYLGELFTRMLKGRIEYWTTTPDDPWDSTTDKQKKELWVREWSELLAFRKQNLPDRCLESTSPTTEQPESIDGESSDEGAHSPEISTFEEHEDSQIICDENGDIAH